MDEITPTVAAKAHLAIEGYASIYGARPLKRAIQRSVRKRPPERQ